MVPIMWTSPTKPGISLSFVLIVCDTDWGIPSLQDKPIQLVLCRSPKGFDRAAKQLHGCGMLWWLSYRICHLRCWMDFSQHANILCRWLRWLPSGGPHSTVKRKNYSIRSYGLIRGIMNSSSQPVFSNITTYLGTIYHNPCLPLFTRYR